MKVIEIKHIEDCFDGSYIKEILFDNKITKDLIIFLKKHGKLKYYESFKRPYFRFEVENKYYIKGVQGNFSVRIFLQQDISENQFINLIERRYATD